MFKKIFLSAIIFFSIWNFCFAETAWEDEDKVREKILLVPFDWSNAWLSDSFERDKNDVSMEHRWDWADSIQSWIMKIVDVLTKFMWFFAFVYLFYTWVLLIIKWDWDELSWAKIKILWTIFALLMTFLIEPLVRNVFFWWWSTLDENWEFIKSWDIFSGTWNAIISAKIWVLQIEWFISYIETFVVLLALVMIIKSAVSMIFSHDEELKLAEQKKTILWTWVWFIIILMSKIIVYFWIYWDPASWTWTDVWKVVTEVSWIMKYFLWFLASLAVAMIIYWWTKMIFSWEEDASEWKEIIKNTIIWAIIISVAYVLVITLIWWKS